MLATEKRGLLMDLLGRLEKHKWDCSNEFFREDSHVVWWSAVEQTIIEMSKEKHDVVE